MCVWVSHLGGRQLFEQVPVANLVAGLTRAVAELKHAMLFLGFLSVNLLFLGFPWISLNELQAACSNCDEMPSPHSTNLDFKFLTIKDFFLKKNFLWFE